MSCGSSRALAISVSWSTPSVAIAARVTVLTAAEQRRLAPVSERLSLRRWSVVFLLLAHLTACADGMFGRRRDVPPASADAATSADAGTVSPPGSDVCARAICPNDAPLESCDDLLAHRECAAPARAYLECIARNRVCQADGTMDVAATTAACESAGTQLQVCLAA